MNRLFIAICTVALFLVGQNNAQLLAPLGPVLGSLPLVGGPDGGLLNLRRSILPVLDGVTDSLPILGGDGGLLNLNLRRSTLPVLDGLTDSLPILGGDGGLLNLNLRRSTLPVLDGVTDSLPILGGDGGLLKLNLRRGIPGPDSLDSHPGKDASTGTMPKGFMKVRRSKAVGDSSRLEPRAPELVANLLAKVAPTVAGLTDTLSKVGV